MPQNGSACRVPVAMTQTVKRRTAWCRVRTVPGALPVSSRCAIQVCSVVLTIGAT